MSNVQSVSAGITVDPCAMPVAIVTASGTVIETVLWLDDTDTETEVVFEELLKDIASERPRWMTIGEVLVHSQAIAAIVPLTHP